MVMNDGHIALIDCGQVYICAHNLCVCVCVCVLCICVLAF